VLDRLGDAEIGDAGLHHGAAVVVVDLEHAVELARPSSTPSASGSAPPDSEVPAPRGTTLTLLVVAVAQDARDLFHRLRQHHHHRHLAVGGQPVGLEGAQLVGVVDHALARHDGLQPWRALKRGLVLLIT
jgi:hypothetical protein